MTVSKVSGRGYVFKLPSLRRRTNTRPSYFVMVLVVSFLLAATNRSHAVPLADYPHAHTMYSSQLELDDYRLALGAMEKVNNRWAAEREQRLTGLLTRKTLSLDEGHSSSEVFDYYITQLRQLGGRELFQCQGRSCGSSNSWANNHFQVKQLYGQDALQQYAAVEVVGVSGSRSYVSLYGIMRGNKRSYMQLDVLATRQAHSLHSSSEVIVRHLSDGLAFSLPGLVWEGNKPALTDQHLKSLLETMQRQRNWRFAIVGHDYSQGEESVRQKLSLTYAQAIKEQLTSKRIPADRIEAFGVGSLAPSVKGRRGESRVLTVIKLD